MNTPLSSITARRIAFVMALLSLPPLALAQTNGTWNINANGNWSATGSWLGGNIADGIGSTADFSQFDITTNRTVTMDTTSRTLGTLLFGDNTGPTFNNYTIAASGGATLTLNNSGSAAVMTQGANSGANSISVPLLVADSLNINNNSASTLTASGTISASTTGTKTITNAGTGDGGVTLSGIISNGSGSVAIVQNSATSVLTLSGANTFDTGVLIKKGTLLANNNAALGTGTLLLGDTTGNADATLSINSFTLVNPITVQGGSSGNTLTISNNSTTAARITGNIILNNALTMTVASGGQTGRNTGAYLNTAATTTISGTGNLNLNVSGNLTTTNNGGGPAMDSLSISGPVTTTGSINNVGTGTGRVLISGVINNASSVNQNSATSLLTLGGVNTYSGATNVNNGALKINGTGFLSPNSTVTVAQGATLQMIGTNGTAGQILNLSGNGTSYSTGALEALNVANYVGNIVLLADSTIADDLANTTLTLSGTSITGTNKTLTTSGVGNLSISAAIGTGSGGINKLGTGTLTLSGTNTFTGLTKISNGTVALGSANALGGGGNITFNGGTLQSSSSNTVDYSSKIVNSTGPISLDTNGQNVAYAGGLGSSNTGGLTKLGSGKLTLSGTNSYTGITAVKAGVLSVSATSAIPVTGTGQIFVDSAGALNSGGAYADVQAWLNSGNITTNSTGAIALTGSSSENIDFTGYSGLSLGASGNATYTGTISPAGGVYRLGGGGAILTLSSTNALTGTNGLVVSNGTVAITAANDFSGASAVTFAAPTNPTLNLSALGGLTNSSLTLNPGATLSITSNTAAGSVTRAAALTLKRGTVTVGGNATVNSTDAITGALTIDSGGNSTVTITPNAGKNTLVNIGSYVHNAGGTALIRGTNLGVNAIASATAGASNIFITTPNLVGDTGTNTTDGGILVGVVGDTAFNGTGFGATGGLLTADSTKGVRLLAAGEYKTSITDAQTQLDNVRLSSAGGTTLTTTVNSATTINSLSILTSAASSAVQVSGTGTLKLSSGVIYSGSTTSTVANTISNTLDFNGKEAVILAGGTADLNLSGVLSNTGGNGLTVYGNKSITLSGTSANTYTGTTTVNGGTLNLSKSTGVDAIIGDLVVNSGGTAVATTSNVIADGSNVTLNGGSLTTSTETIASIALTGGGFNSYNSSPGSVLTISGNASASGLNNFSTASTLSSNTGGQLVVGGTLSLSDGGRLVVASSWNPSGAYDGSATLGGLNITNTSSGAYTAVIINSSNSAAQSGGQLILNGDVTFTGNTTNTNTVLIDAIKGSGRQGVIALTATNGNRTFNIGNGAAATDLEITAALLDGVGGASNLVKAGAGTLALSGANTYSGNTAVNAGALTLADTGSLTFYIGANGTNNAVTGSGTATFNGSFNFDLTNAAAVNGNSWNIVNVATLSESFTGTFVVNGFVENANVWTFGNYSFSEATGILTYGAIPEPSTYALLGGAAALFLAAFRRRAGKRDSASS